MEQMVSEAQTKYPNLKNLFEIGCHRGKDIPMLLDLWPESHVYAFEADPCNYQIAFDKFKDNPRVTVVYAAVTDKDGPVTFNRYYDIKDITDEQTFEGQNFVKTGIGSILKPGDGLKNIFHLDAPYETINVEGISLESYCRKNNIESIDGIFMDIQGNEYWAFVGCGKLLDTVKATVFEWSRQHIIYEGEKSLEEITDLLGQYGLVEVSRKYQFPNISGDSLFLKKKD